MRDSLMEAHHEVVGTQQVWMGDLNKPYKAAVGVLRRLRRGVLRHGLLRWEHSGREAATLVEKVVDD